MIILSCMVVVGLLVGCAPSEPTAEVVSDDMDDMDSMDDSMMDDDMAEDDETMDDDMNSMDDDMMQDDMMDADADVEIMVTGENFVFYVDGVENPDIVVQEGDTVTVTFSSTEGFHDWVVDEFDAATEQVRTADGETSVTFVASEKGTYEYHCSVGSHRANGMVGNLIVE